jgi:hypothetical protein
MPADVSLWFSSSQTVERMSKLDIESEDPRVEMLNTKGFRSQIAV